MDDFISLNLCQPLLDALDEIGYVTPTPIQAQAIPDLIEGRDMLACAQTGTGKTAAFALPILDAIAEEYWAGSRQIRALVVCPTRELASQIQDNIEQYARHLDIRSLAIFGGVSPRPQQKVLRRGVDILVATPGRLLDLMSQRYVDLSYVQFLVLDEADRMLDMGFIRDIEKILAQIPENRQSLLFSATMPRSIIELSRDILYDPVSVSVTPESTTVEAIEQSLMFVMRSDKRGLLTYIIQEQRPNKVLVFSRTKHGCNRIVKQLGQDGIEALAIHGNKSQGAREKALGRFRNGTLQVLIATDVASRGIDVSDISHVINLDLPNEPDVYVHRIGRTGRAGRGGIAIAFCDENEGEYLRGIEKSIGQEITVDEDQPFHSEKARSRKGNRAPKRHQNKGRGRRHSRNTRSNDNRSSGKSNTGRSKDGRKVRQSGHRRNRRRQRQNRS
ncbi:MAG: DEAD/DEAH box helicase [Candidatus Thermoplasmatota archaeon]|nr:DEAD/DEAH box helicase [Candidatus Thermoplasmatota archaeon]